MSRSGLSEGDGEDVLAYGRWRGAVRSAMRGRRGQSLLREIAAALDAMPSKSLTTNALQADGEFCTIGVVMHARGMDPSAFDEYDYAAIADALGVNEKIVQEVEWQNDETIRTHDWIEHCGPPAPRRGRWDPTERIEVNEPLPDPGREHWQRMRKYIESQIAKDHP